MSIIVLCLANPLVAQSDSTKNYRANNDRFLPPAGAALEALTIESTPVEEGYRDFFHGLDQPVTGEKPESKLWWNDGIWWGCLWDPLAEGYRIYRFDVSSQSWINTATAVDDRLDSRADALWDGGKLYIVSHIFSHFGGGANDPLAARLYRYSYDPTLNQYSLDFGFPVIVNHAKSETLTLAKDSSGKLWITWVENGKVMVNRSTTDDKTWGNPFELSVQGANTDSDDISAVLAFGGTSIGIMWSNQNDEKIYFSLHHDGEPDESWDPRETALEGNNVADDHLNLSPSCDANGNIYAVSKTSLNGDTDPGIYVMKRTPAGSWSKYVFAERSEIHTRPILLVDSDNQQLYVFATSHKTGDSKIYMKVSDLNNISFPPGLGTVFIASSSDSDINNPTSTKQCITDDSGLLVLASDEKTRYYLHNYIELDDGRPKILSFDPQYGLVGTAVTINGKNYDSATEVAFNGLPDPNFVVVNDKQIQATVPDSAKSGPISVTNNLGTVESQDYFVIGRAPVVSVIADQMIAEGDTLEITFSASDPDSQNVSFSVNNLPSFGSLTDNGDGTGHLLFLPGPTDQGTYAIEVVATDDGPIPVSGVESFTLTIENVNAAPVLAMLEAQVVNESDTLDVALAASDIDGDSLIFTFNNLPEFASRVDDGLGNTYLRFTPDFDHAGVYPNIEVIVLDPFFLADTAVFQLTVNNTNRAPQLIPISDQGMDENNVLEIPLTASDPDNDTIVLGINNLPPFGNFVDHGNGTGTISLNPGFADAGVYENIEIIAIDDADPALLDVEIFTLTVNNVNRKPVVAEILNQTMNENVVLEVTVTATDPDGDALTLTANNLPNFGTFLDQGNGSGKVVFASDFEDAGNYQNIEIVATDKSSPPLSDHKTFNLTVNNVNRPPKLAAIPDNSMGENETLSFFVSSSDPDGDGISLSVANFPAFGSFNDYGNGTGTISFESGVNDSGNYLNILVIARDKGIPSLADTVSFNLIVTNSNDPPRLTEIPDQTTNEGESLEITVSATDPDGDAIALTVENLPAFGGFVDNGDGSGKIVMSPGFADAGVYPNIEVVATDDGMPSLTGGTVFSLTVNDINRGPEIVAILNQSMLEGETLDIPLSASDPDGDELVFTVNNLPVFGQLTDNGNGSGVIHFNPDFSTAGTYSNIEVKVTDKGSGSLSAATTFLLNVGNRNRRPVSENDSITTGEDIPVTIKALANDSDPDGEALTIQSFIADSTAGTVTIVEGDTTLTYRPQPDVSGIDRILYVASDGNGGLDTATVWITITPVNDVPVIDGLPDSLMFDLDDAGLIELFDIVSDVETPVNELEYAFKAVPDVLVLEFEADLGRLVVSAKDRFHPTTADLIITVNDPEGGSTSDTVAVYVGMLVGIENRFQGIIPKEYQLSQNYPNPFNPETQIRFGLPKAEKVRIEIFNLLGQRVQTAVDAQFEGGYHVISIDGRTLASGIYLYRITAGQFQAIKKMILLK